MTATTTPRLGLLSPTSADDFDIADFVNTMSILDNTPGIKQVANLASLPSGLTTAQNGSIYLQMDNNSLWMWSKPGSPAGTWKKINTTGLIKQANQTSPISTTATVLTSAPTMLSTTYTHPGGRWVLCFFSHRAVYNTGSYGYSTIDMLINGTSAENSILSGGSPNKAISHRLFQPIFEGQYGITPGSTVTVSLKPRATNYGGGTTTADALGQLYIIEL